MVYIYNNVEITNQQFETLDGTKYPSNWLELSTDQDKDLIGVITLIVVYPELNENEMYLDTYVDDYNNLTRTYNKAEIE